MWAWPNMKLHQTFTMKLHVEVVAGEAVKEIEQCLIRHLSSYISHKSFVLHIVIHQMLNQMPNQTSQKQLSDHPAWNF